MFAGRALPQQGPILTFGNLEFWCPGNPFFFSLARNNRGLPPGQRPGNEIEQKRYSSPESISRLGGVGPLDEKKRRQKYPNQQQNGSVNGHAIPGHGTIIRP